MVQIIEGKDVTDKRDADRSPIQGVCFFFERSVDAQTFADQYNHIHGFNVPDISELEAVAEFRKVGCVPCVLIGNIPSHEIDNTINMTARFIDKGHLPSFRTVEVLDRIIPQPEG